MGLSFKDDMNCSICLESVNNHIGMLDRCHHFFHYNCISDWQKISSECPLCRNPFGGVMLGSFVDSQFIFSTDDPPQTCVESEGDKENCQCVQREIGSFYEELEVVIFGRQFIPPLGECNIAPRSAKPSYSECAEGKLQLIIPLCESLNEYKTHIFNIIALYMDEKGFATGNSFKLVGRREHKKNYLPRI